MQPLLAKRYDLCLFNQLNFISDKKNLNFYDKNTSNMTIINKMDQTPNFQNKDLIQNK